MTQTTFIILNAILGAGVAYGLILLLAFGIGSERRVRDEQVGQLRRASHDRLAA